MEGSESTPGGGKKKKKEKKVRATLPHSISLWTPHELRIVWAPCWGHWVSARLVVLPPWRALYVQRASQGESHTKKRKARTRSLRSAREDAC